MLFTAIFRAKALAANSIEQTFVKMLVEARAVKSKSSHSDLATLELVADLRVVLFPTT